MRVIWENGILIAPEGKRTVMTDLACHFREEEGVIEPMSCLSGNDHVDTFIRQERKVFGGRFSILNIVQMFLRGKVRVRLINGSC